MQSAASVGAGMAVCWTFSAVRTVCVRVMCVCVCVRGKGPGSGFVQILTVGGSEVRRHRGLILRRGLSE